MFKQSYETGKFTMPVFYNIINCRRLCKLMFLTQIVTDIIVVNLFKCGR